MMAIPYTHQQRMTLRGVRPEDRNCVPQAPSPAAAPPADFAARFSGLAEDMPRLQKDAYLQEDTKVLFLNFTLS